MDRRWAKVKVTQSIMQEILTTGWSVGGSETLTCTKGIPTGAQLVQTYYDNAGYAVLVFEHESFDSVTLGNPIPDVDVVWTVNVNAESFE